MNRIQCASKIDTFQTLNYSLLPYWRSNSRCKIIVTKLQREIRVLRCSHINDLSYPKKRTGTSQSQAIANQNYILLELNILLIF